MTQREVRYLQRWTRTSPPVPSLRLTLGRQVGSEDPVLCRHRKGSWLLSLPPGLCTHGLHITPTPSWGYCPASASPTGPTISRRRSQPSPVLLTCQRLSLRPDKDRLMRLPGWRSTCNYPAPRLSQEAFTRIEKYRTSNNGVFRVGGYF